MKKSLPAICAILALSTGGAAAQMNKGDLINKIESPIIITQPGTKQSATGAAGINTTRSNIKASNNVANILGPNSALNNGVLSETTTNNKTVTNDFTGSSLTNTTVKDNVINMRKEPPRGSDVSASITGAVGVNSAIATVGAANVANVAVTINASPAGGLSAP